MGLGRIGPGSAFVLGARRCWPLRFAFHWLPTRLFFHWPESLPWPRAFGKYYRMDEDLFWLLEKNDWGTWQHDPVMNVHQVIVFFSQSLVSRSAMRKLLFLTMAMLGSISAAQRESESPLLVTTVFENDFFSCIYDPVGDVESFPTCDRICAGGHACQLERVDCVREPCYPVENCVPRSKSRSSFTIKIK